MSLESTLRERLAAGKYDTKYPAVGSVMTQALGAYEKLRDTSAAIARNDHLAGPGKRAELTKAATELAPAIGRSRRQLAAATNARQLRHVAMVTQVLRPRDKTDAARVTWDVTIWSYLKSLTQGELIASASANFDVMRVALTAPIPLPNLSAPAREQLLAAHLQATCGRELAAFEDEDEALALAKAAVDAATIALQEATGMQHGTAFDQWMGKATPPTEKELTDERQQSASFELERLSREGSLLPIAERLELHRKMLDSATAEVTGRAA